MDVRFINPFLTAVTQLFNTMLEKEVNIGKPVLKSHREAPGDVSAIIGLSGDVTGCVAVCFPMPTAIKAASTFSGVEMTADHEDFADALGELANMVAGQAKAKLDGLAVGISLPSVIIGKEHVISQSKQTPRLCIPCDSTLGHFTVEVAMVIEMKPAVQTPQPATAGACA